MHPVGAATIWVFARAPGGSPSNRNPQLRLPLALRTHGARPLCRSQLRHCSQRSLARVAFRRARPCCASMATCARAAAPAAVRRGSHVERREITRRKKGHGKPHDEGLQQDIASTRMPPRGAASRLLAVHSARSRISGCTLRTAVQAMARVRWLRLERKMAADIQPCVLTYIVRAYYRRQS